MREGTVPAFTLGSVSFRGVKFRKKEEENRIRKKQKNNT